MTSTIKKRYKEAAFSMRDDSCIKLKAPYCSSLRHRRVIKIKKKCRLRIPRLCSTPQILKHKLIRKHNLIPKRLLIPRS